MTRRLVPAAVAAAALSIAAFAPAAAHATAASATLGGLNGEGSFNPTLDCAEGGDGDSWRYRWEDQLATSPGGLLGGLWNGSFEVHDAGGGKAFIPTGDGRVSISLPTNQARTGTAGFDTAGDGTCSAAPLTLVTQPDGDPQATGTVPVTATGGTGALRGLTGTGQLQLSLELGAGADNVAQLGLTGDFDVADPALGIASAGAGWLNLTEWLQRRVRVSVTVRNTGVGNAYGVRLTKLTGGTGSFSGLPTTAQDIPAGEARTFGGVVMYGAQPNATYTVQATAAGSDGLLAPQPPTTGPSTFKTPLLP